MLHSGTRPSVWIGTFYYQRDRRPRRLVYSSFGLATLIPVLWNCSPWPRRAAERLTSACCSGRTSVLPRPDAPARPVRPTRWT